MEVRRLARLQRPRPQPLRHRRARRTGARRRDPQRHIRSHHLRARRRLAPGRHRTARPVQLPNHGGHARRANLSRAPRTPHHPQGGRHTAAPFSCSPAARGAPGVLHSRARPPGAFAVAHRPRPRAPPHRSSSPPRSAAISGSRGGQALTRTTPPARATVVHSTCSLPGHELGAGQALTRTAPDGLAQSTAPTTRTITSSLPAAVGRLACAPDRRIREAPHRCGCPPPQAR
jgi:hypothetical protein